MTATNQRLVYARVCIDIKPESPLPQSIEIADYEGNIYQQDIEYEWLPKICEVCRVIGHKQPQCPNVVRKDWKPKNANRDDQAINKAKQKAEVEAPVKEATNSQKGEATAIVTYNKYNTLEDIQHASSQKSKEKTIAPTPLAMIAPIKGLDEENVLDNSLDKLGGNIANGEGSEEVAGSHVKTTNAENSDTGMVIIPTPAQSQVSSQEGQESRMQTKILDQSGQPLAVLPPNEEPRQQIQSPEDSSTTKNRRKKPKNKAQPLSKVSSYSSPSQ